MTERQENPRLPSFMGPAIPGHPYAVYPFWDYNNRWSVSTYQLCRPPFNVPGNPGPGRDDPAGCVVPEPGSSLEEAPAPAPEPNPQTLAGQVRARLAQRRARPQRGPRVGRRTAIARGHNYPGVRSIRNFVTGDGRRRRGR